MPRDGAGWSGEAARGVPPDDRKDVLPPLSSAKLALICDLVRLQAVAAVPKTPSPAAMPQKQRRFPRNEKESCLSAILPEDALFSAVFIPVFYLIFAQNRYVVRT